MRYHEDFLLKVATTKAAELEREASLQRSLREKQYPKRLIRRRLAEALLRLARRLNPELYRSPLPLDCEPLAK